MNSNLAMLYQTRPGIGFARFILSAVFTAFFISLFISPTFVRAEGIGCGDIVAPNYYFDYPRGDNTEERDHIEDCTDPFGVTTDPASPYQLQIAGEEVIDGETVAVPVGGTNQFVVLGTRHMTVSNQFLFRHEEGDYVFVDIRAPEITEQSVIDYAPVYFAGSPDLAMYQEVVSTHFGSGLTDEYFFDENGDYIYDANGDMVQSRFYEFLDAAEVALYIPPAKVGAGTYTMVIREDLLILSQSDQRSILEKVRDLFINTAYAQYYVPPNIYTITFTLREGEIESKPSVLFLPGIMGSRLYEESEECNPYSNTAFEQTRWFSMLSCDIERLSMNSLGQSDYDLYTKVDSVIDEVRGQNLYKSLMADLEDWKQDGSIADYQTLPYDWRLSLHEIIKAREINGRIVPNTTGTYKDGYIYKSLESMIEASPEEKVVLIGHSNGGLVIKTLLATMKVNGDPLLSAVDKVILVAVPQIGTPESVSGLLHGVEIAKGIVLTKEESRKILNTSPFGYHLLPTDEYYNEVATPVIKIEAGTSTDAWRAQFGAELDSQDEVTAFIQKESGRPSPDWTDTTSPATGYSHLIGYANSMHDFIKDWRPASTSVYQVAGIGVDTPSTVTYFTNTKCINSGQDITGEIQCNEFESKLGYRVEYVIDGDETVVVPSALATNSSSDWWLNFLEYNSLFRNSRTHKDITEVDEVRELILGITSNSSMGTFEYLSTTEPNFSSTNRLVYRLHSPLDLYVILEDGEVVGSSTPNIRGVSYRRYGEVQQLSIGEEEEDYEIILNGISTGSFTFEIDKYRGNDLEDRASYSAIPTATSTKVSYKVGEENLAIDYQGDGVFETLAIPGLAKLSSVNSFATTTAEISQQKTNPSSTRVKNDKLAQAPKAVLSSVTIETKQRQLMLDLIRLLIIYRDLLNLQK